MPWVPLLIAFVLASPVIVALAHAFLEDGHLSIAYLGSLASDAPRLLGLVGNTMGVAMIAAVISLTVGVPLSLFVFRTDLPGRKIWALIVLATCCLPPYVVLSSWMSMFDLQVWGLRLLPAGWVLGVSYIPLVSLICGAAFVSIDPTLERLAILDASPWQVVRSVTLKQAAPGIFAAGLVVVVLTVSDIAVTDVMMVRTFTEEVFVEFQLNRTPGPAAAVAVPMVVGVVACGMIILLILRHVGESQEHVEASDPFTYRLGRWRTGLACVVLLGFLLLALPFFSLMRATEGIRHFVQTLEGVSAELGYSLLLGSLAALFAALLAWGPAAVIARRRRCRILLSSWVLGLMVVPAPLVGIGLTELLNQPGWTGWLYDSPFVVVLVLLVRFLPYQVLVVLLAIRSVPVSLEEDAFACGATRLGVARHVIAPLCIPGALLGAMLVLILSLGEVGASVLVVPPGWTTLTIRFFTLVHYGIYADAAAICLILAGIVVLLSTVLAVSANAVSWLRANNRGTDAME